MTGDVIQWKGANGKVSGTIVEQDKEKALIELPNGKHMELSLSYIKKHNPQWKP